MTKKRMGRPELAPEVRKATIVGCRVDDDVRAQFENAASAAGLSGLARLGSLIFADESLSASGRMSSTRCR